MSHPPLSRLWAGAILALVALSAPFQSALAQSTTSDAAADGFFGRAKKVTGDRADKLRGAFQPR
ncbi:MAG: hypothetical protein H6907_15875, partial [Hyphomicrobiales bacterium]|nr:hypothetical protein [Hyphomicrobiales bacterium]